MRTAAGYKNKKIAQIRSNSQYAYKPLHDAKHSRPSFDAEYTRGFSQSSFKARDPNQVSNGHLALK